MEGGESVFGIYCLREEKIINDDDDDEGGGEGVRVSAQKCWTWGVQTKLDKFLF